MEVEFVSVDHAMPQVVWSRYFLEHQGWRVSDCVAFQENKSAILLEQDGRTSSGKQTRRLNIRYFFTGHLARELYALSIVL